MKNVNVGFESLIADMIKTGTSIEDIATLFADALNAESVKAAAAKEAKEKDALTIMKMVAAFMGTHYGDKNWDDEIVAKCATEFVKTMDAAQDMMKSLDKISLKTEPVVQKFVKKTNFDEAMAEFEKLLKSL